MPFTLAADAVVLVHLLWILFIMLGAWIGRRVPWVKWVHVGALGFSVLLQVRGWLCPLTFLEHWLRTRSGPGQDYPGDFIAHYAERLVYLDVSRDAVLAATAVIIIGSLWAYWPGRRS
jgi:hypothetical protein